MGLYLGGVDVVVVVVAVILIRVLMDCFFASSK
jgi:hypothetical protein